MIPLREVSPLEEAIRTGECTAVIIQQGPGLFRCHIGGILTIRAKLGEEEHFLYIAHPYDEKDGLTKEIIAQGIPREQIRTDWQEAMASTAIQPPHSPSGHRAVSLSLANRKRIQTIVLPPICRNWRKLPPPTL